MADNLLQRIKNVFIPQKDVQTTQSDTSTKGTDAVIAEYEKLKADRDRISKIKTCRLMYDSDSRIEKAHRVYSQDIVKAGFLVVTKDERAKQIAVDLQKRIDMNQLLEDAVRETSRDGDSFYEVVIDDDLQITELSRKPTLQVHRASNDYDKFSDPNRAFWQGTERWMSPEPPKDAVWFPQWQMIHARWKHDSGERYGKPMFSASTGAYKKVDDGELNMAVRRKMSASQIRLHIVEGSPSDLETYKEKNKSAFGRLNAVTDLFMNKKGTIDVKQGDGNIDKMGDVQHFVATMMAGSDVPMELIVYGEGLNRDILGEKKEEYENNQKQGREWLTSQIVKPVLERQWLLNGILPAMVNYQIVWRTAKKLSPAELRDLSDALARLKLLGVKDEVIQVIAASYIQDVEDDILNMEGFSVDQFAQNLKGISV